MDNFSSQFPSWLISLLSIEIFRQVGGVILIFVLSRVIVRFVKRQLDKIHTWVREWQLIQDFLWLLDIFPIFNNIIMPLSAWITGNIAIGAFQNLEWEHEFLMWTVPIFSLWLLYRLLYTIINLRFKPAQAKIWGNQVLRPLFFLNVVLHALGVLDDLLNLSLYISEDILITLRSLLSGLVILYLTIILSRNLRTLLRDSILPRTKIEPALNHAISTLTAYALLLVGTLMSISTIGVNLTTLTLILGGLSVGIGFGLQELINNFISGFILLFEQTISPGDVIEVDNEIGTVEDIGIRSMQIRTVENIRLVVPNGRVLSNVVTNYSHGDPKISIPISIVTSYSENPHKIQELMLEAAKHPDVLGNPQ